MKHENCENCLVYDELMEGILAPCDEEEAWSSTTVCHMKKESQKRYGPGRTPARIGLSQNHLEGTIQ